jgi:hypothetical protein
MQRQVLLLKFLQMVFEFLISILIGLDNIINHIFELWPSILTKPNGIVLLIKLYFTLRNNLFNG